MTAISPHENRFLRTYASHCSKFFETGNEVSAALIQAVENQDSSAAAAAPGCQLEIEKLLASAQPAFDLNALSDIPPGLLSKLRTVKNEARADFHRVSAGIAVV